MREISYATLVSLPIRLALQLRRQISRLALIAIVCGLAGMIFAIAGRAQESQATPQSSPKGNAASPPQPLTAPASLPPSSLIPPEQVRSGEPQVSFDGKQLTIIANNSTLSDILDAVRASTGAEIDVPAGAPGQHLAEVRLGPGPAREVLASLLSWTDFDYIIQASDKNPQGIHNVLLVARGKAPAGVATSLAALASQSRTGASRSVPEPAPIPAVTLAPEDPVPPPQETPAEVAPAGREQPPARQTLESHPDPPQFRSTEQMIQEMQSMFQQRRQMQSNQNAQPATKPPTAN